MAAVRVDNFVVWLCVDDRNEETDCGTPNDPVLEITTVKDGDGDGDSADDANNTGDDMGWYSDNDDWPATDDGDTAECVVGIYDGDDDRDGDDIDKDDDNNDDVRTVSGKVDEETEGSGASSIKNNKKDWTKELTKLTEFSTILYYNIATVIIIIIIIIIIFRSETSFFQKNVLLFSS